MNRKPENVTPLYGALNEISGSLGMGKTEFILNFLARNPGQRVAWLEDSLTAYPCAFPEHGVDLSRVLFVEAGRDLVWAALQVLASRLFPVVIVSVSPENRLSEIEMRRLQLASEQARASVIILCVEPTRGGTWPIALQATVGRKENGQEPAITILKERRLWMER